MSSMILTHNFKNSYDTKHDLNAALKETAGYKIDTIIKSVNNLNDSANLSSQHENLIEKVLKLVTDPHSCQLFERHVHQLNKLASKYSEGFYLKDLQGLSIIFASVCKQIDSYTNILPILIKLFKIFGNPFIKTISSDEVNYQASAIEVFSQFAFLIALPFNETREEICKSLKNLYTKEKKNSIESLNFVSKTYLQNCIEKSSVVDTLMKSISLVNLTDNCLILLLELLKELTKKSTINSCKALGANGVVDLCKLLTFNLGKDLKQVRYVSAELIWNLVEFSNASLVDQQFNNVECLSVIKEAFTDQLNSSISSFDREFRNDLLTIISLILKCFDEQKYTSMSGLAKCIALLATHQEVKNHNILVRHLKLQPKISEDFELKKLLLQCLILMGKDDKEIFKIYSETNVMAAMLYYLQAPILNGGDKFWNAPQLLEIQIYCLKVLIMIGQKMVEDLLQHQGQKCLLEFIDFCVEQDTSQSASSSSSSACILPSRLQHVHSSILVIKNLISLRDKDVVDEFAMQGVFERSLALLQILPINLNQELLVLKTQIDIMDIIAEICSTDSQYKEMFGQLGVDLLIPRINILNLLEIDSVYTNLVASAINCLWSTVIANFSLEDYFMDCSGVSILLDQLQVGPMTLRNQLIGCLLDLLSNGNARRHLLGWQGKGGLSAARMFCQMWRQEEKQLGVPRTQRNFIEDLKQPLQSDVDLLDESEQQSVGSRAINDVFDNLRAKIYGIFSMIGFMDLPPLEAEDHVTLVIIQNYFNLKLAEVWQETKRELDAEQIRPITPDEEAVQIILEGAYFRAEDILKTQNEILEAEDMHEKQLEQQCYVQIRELHLQDEFKLKKLNEYLERTSNYSVLKETKARLNSAINASRSNTTYLTKDSFQKLTLDSLNNTNFPGKMIKIINFNNLEKFNTM